MIGALQLALVIAVPMQATAGITALSMRAHEPESNVSSQFSTLFPRHQQGMKRSGEVGMLAPRREARQEFAKTFVDPSRTSRLRDRIPTTRRDASHRVSTPDEWLGNDKLRHFLISMAVTQFTYGGLRTASTNDDVALPIAIGVATVGSVGKEVHDARNDGTFSLKDLAWDAAGIAIAGILLGSIR